MSASFLPQDEWIPSPQIRRRFFISDMSLWRWRHDPKLGFPKPTKIRNRNYWRASDIAAWEKRTVLAACQEKPGTDG